MSTVEHINVTKDGRYELPYKIKGRTVYLSKEDVILLGAVDGRSLARMDLTKETGFPYWKVAGMSKKLSSYRLLTLGREDRRGSTGRPGNPRIFVSLSEAGKTFMSLVAELGTDGVLFKGNEDSNSTNTDTGEINV